MTQEQEILNDIVPGIEGYGRVIEARMNEHVLLEELRKYIDSTYRGHYAKADGGQQTIERIVAKGRGIDYCLGNIEKYVDRYGFKGTEEDHRKDLIKIAHYAILALYAHDLKHGGEK